MLILHGSWIPATAAQAACFALWGELGPDARPPAKRRGRRAAAAVPEHPFAAAHDQIAAALAPSGPESETVTLGRGQAAVRLPSLDGAPLPSLDLASSSHDGEAATLAGWSIAVLTAPAAGAPALLLSLNGERLASEVILGSDLRFWTAAARFACDLLVRQRLLPALEKRGALYLARWQAALDEERDAGRLAALAGAMPPVCRTLGWDGAAPALGPRGLLLDFLNTMLDALVRQAHPAGALAQAPTPAPKGVKSSANAQRPAKASGAAPQPSAGEVWLAALHGDPALRGDPQQIAALYDQYRAWVSAAPATGASDSFRICFRLDPPPPGPGAENLARPNANARDWSLSYLLQAADDPSLLVPAAEVWRQRSATARFLNRRFDQPQERLLAALGQAARLFPPIESSLRTARPEACLLTAGEAHAFLRETALLLQASGFAVLAPRLDTRLSVRLKLGRKDSKTRGPSSFGWDALVEYDWQVALGGEPLTREEFEALAALKEPLVQVRGRWVEVRPEQIEQALAFFQQQDRGGQMALADVLPLALNPDGQHGLPITEVVTEGWLDDLLGRLRNGAERHQQLADPPGLAGRLRPYQQVGLSWLATLRHYGLGGCLADDMGLGKTIQLIALLLYERSAGDGGAGTPGPSLLICPTSVVGNWRRELERFAPSLRLLVHHGAERTRQDFAAEAARYDLVISSYALLHRDEEQLAGVTWDNLVLDEAQNIKNASTKVAQAARRLPARWKVALTGTPVENRLTELWSIFQFLNPGYLGPAEDFRRRFANPIERGHDPEAAARLKALTAPFILRRLKTDRTIIADLPEKNEMKVYCTLTQEQATLYEAVVRDSLRQIDEAEGMQRRGLILATLTKLKQVCNHPALFLHDGSALEGRSGKLARLGEMLEEVVTVGERALIFTQYAEMGKQLQAHLQATLGREALFLHGGTPAAARDRMVARFQAEGHGPQVFVLSIKAGGTGLNLTNANHVFHFDRWWNPAVENQATDRAFRIGQRRDVQVHKFICAGTFEEVLDEIIERKVALAEAIVGAGENWITEMNTEELRGLFALRQDAVAA